MNRYKYLAVALAIVKSQIPNLHNFEVASVQVEVFPDGLAKIPGENPVDTHLAHAYRHHHASPGAFP